ncbi:MAG: AraC family transcriptional activator FtrA [Flavobacteriales bacterium]|jgi:AraC family transcriptional activator FtrA
MKRVAILVYDQCALFELSSAIELFALPRPELKDWYETELVSFYEGPMRTTAGLSISGTKRVRTFKNYDTLVISSWPPSDSLVAPELYKAIEQFHNEGGRLLSFCSGSFLLARCGLLKGRNATTHWRYADKFKQDFPDVNYVDDVLYVYENNIGTSAGSAAGLDLGIAVIREDYDYNVANQVARRLVIAAHRNGGQSQFVETPVAKRPDLFSETLDWALINLHTTLSIENLAERACMSRRTFDRKFRASMNMSPQTWLIDQRLHLARELLESTTETVDTVATCAGFDNAITLRHHFRKRLGLSPSQYRESFQARSCHQL